MAEPKGTIAVRLVPLAWTPAGVVLAKNGKDVGVPLQGLFDWMDRTFAAEDETAFVATVRDLELLIRIGFERSFPDELRAEHVVNVDDLPEELVDALEHPATELVMCATCRRLCVRDDFVWKEKQLCAWDYHASVFGRRGPWQTGAYEARRFPTLPSCAYVVPGLLAELGVENVLTLGAIADEAANDVVGTLLAREPARAYLVVRAGEGLAVLREG
ncbi:MAG: hypothetical protein JO030_03265 [Candidatus Eremiobacteraeota bacterium]|nr:hypothetical protein [Candidatus Eremiobacteraeota bacterium]